MSIVYYSKVEHILWFELMLFVSLLEFFEATFGIKFIFMDNEFGRQWLWECKLCAHGLAGCRKVNHQVEVSNVELHHVVVNSPAGFESFTEVFIRDMVVSKINKMWPLCFSSNRRPYAPSENVRVVYFLWFISNFEPLDLLHVCFIINS